MIGDHLLPLDATRFLWTSSPAYVVRSSMTGMTSSFCPRLCRYHGAEKKRLYSRHEPEG